MPLAPRPLSWLLSPLLGLALACGGTLAGGEPKSGGPTTIASVARPDRQLPLGEEGRSLHAAEAPPSLDPAGGGAGGAGGPGKVGKAGGPGKVGKTGGPGAGLSTTLAFNNASVVATTADGSLHAVWVEQGTARYRRVDAEGRVHEESLGRARAPTLATDGGRHLLIVLADQGLRVRLSADGGATWSAESTLSASRAMNPSAALWQEGGALRGAVVWHQPVEAETGEGPRGRGPSHVLGALLVGSTFTAPQRLDQSPHEAAFATVHGSSGGAQVLWRERDAPGAERRVMIRTVQGASFGPSRLLVRGGLDPSVCVDGQGRVHVGYQDERKGAWYIRSTDGGQSFTSPLRLDWAGLFVRVSCNARGEVALAWEHFEDPLASFADDSAKSLGLAWSRDGGASFQVLQPAEGERGLALGSCALDEQGGLSLAWIKDGSALVVRRLEPAG